MIKLISPDMVYVTGAKCSAIYNFKGGKVYSINLVCTEAIKKYFLNKSSLTDGDISCINRIKKMIGISEFNDIDYVFPEDNQFRLKFVWLSLTERCNMKCIHCYEGNNHFEMKKIMSFEKWISLLDEIYEVGCRRICFIGGEPTLYDKLPELIDYAYKKRFNEIILYSNLFFLSERLLSSIVGCNCIVKFSVYGSTEVVHESITQVKGSFKKLVDNLNILNKNNVKLDVASIIMKENEHDRENINLFLRNINIKPGKIDEIRKVYGGSQHQHLLKKPKCFKSFPNFKTDKNYFDKYESKNTCWYGEFTIASNGDVYPCEFERMITYGNVTKQSIKEILNSPNLKKCWGMSFKCIEFCKDCEYRFACKDCRPLGYAERGILTDKNYRCKYNPYTGEWDSKK